MKKKPFKLNGINMTIKHWLELLKPEYKEKAIKEFEKYGPQRMDMTTHSLGGALNKFNWEGSKEGHAFWSRLVDDLQNPGSAKRYLNYKEVTQLID